MTILTAASGIDMTGIDLADTRDGTTTTSTSTKWQVDGLTTAKYIFTGTGLTYSGGRPDAGTIDKFVLKVSGVTFLTIEGAIPAADLSGFIAANDPTGMLTEWFAGNDTLNGSSADDHLLGFNGNDTFNLTAGGEDFAEGSKGNDTFNLGATLTAADRFEGGKGADTLTIDADTFFDFSAFNMIDVETVELSTGHFYQLTFVDGNVGNGGLLVDGSALGTGDSMVVGMAGGSNKGLTAIGGRGADVFQGADGKDNFTGGRGDDFFNGGKNADNLTGGNGADSFVYNLAVFSTGVNYDTINDFNASSEDLIRLTFTLNGVRSALTVGALSTSTFDTDMEAAIPGSVLGKHEAMLFTPDTGTLAGLTFLLIDMNNNKGYQANKDVVILMSDTSGLGGLDPSDFSFIG